MNNQILRQAKRIKSKLYNLSHKRIASPIEVERVEQIFYISYLKEGMTVFDIGANIGELTLLFSRFVGISGKVHAFEASKTTFEQLSTVCKISNRPQIYLNHSAVADVQGTLRLNVYDENHSGWNSLANRPLHEYGINVQPIYCEDVDAITLDSYCEHNNIDYIDLLKIDVEGAEYQVMLGAKQLLSQHRIRCCVFEFGGTTFDMGNTPRQIENFLENYGYTISNIVKENPIFPGRQSSKTAQFSLHVATPRK